MSEQAQLLAKMSAELEKASSEFSAKAESALGEAKKAGTLSAETKAAVDEMALKFNTLTEAEKQLKAQLGELEQEFARIPTQAAAAQRETLGGTVIKSEALAEFAKSIQGNPFGTGKTKTKAEKPSPSSVADKLRQALTGRQSA